MIERIQSQLVRRTASTLVACLLVAAWPTAAAAHNFGSNTAAASGFNPTTPAHACDTSVSSECVANDGTHTVQDADLTSAWHSALSNAVTIYNNDPSVAVSWVTNFDPDVYAFDFAYGMTGWVAVTTCDDDAIYGGTDPGRWCRPQDIQFNTSYAQTTTKRKAIACHELGHTLGLRHRNSDEPASCMLNGTYTTTTFSSHDSSMLATRY